MPLVAFENLSKIGLSTYRMSILNKDHRWALKLAVRYGCNLIGTFSNYQYCESENLIGKFIEEYPQKKLFVVTKAGYVTRNEMRALTTLKKKSFSSNE